VLKKRKTNMVYQRIGKSGESGRETKRVESKREGKRQRGKERIKYLL